MININIKLRFWITLFMLCYFTFIIYAFLDTFLLRIKINDGYAVGDWMINYQDGGFKRRGLSGSLIMFISDVTGIFVGKIIFLINIILYLLFACFTTFLISKIRLRTEHFLFLIFPTSFLFLINDEYAVGRKETILYVLFLLFLFTLDKLQKINWILILVFSSLLLISLFFHELVLFYFPYFILVLILDYQIKKVPIDFKKLFLFSLIIVIPAAIIFLLGGDLNQGKTWDILKKYGLSIDVMNGILAWPKEGFSTDKVNALPFAEEHNYFFYSIPLLFTYTTIFISIARLQIERKIKIWFVCLIILIFLGSIPLFFLTIDWGRWIHIHVVMIFLTLFYFSKRNGLTFFEKETIKIKKIQLIGFIIVSFVGLILLMFTTMKHVEDGFLVGNSNTYMELKQIYYYILEWVR